MSKHTPGPWFIHGLMVYGPDENHPVADCDGDTEEQLEANARLIAASPALLEALEEAAAHLEYTGYGDSWERECAEAGGLEAKIKAAIAKARGV